MGPRLGPLIVTSVLATVTPRARSSSRRVRAARSAKRIGDSKKLVAFDDSALGEAWARALAMRDGITARTPAELLAAVALDDAGALQAPCPSHHTDLCWATEGESFASRRRDGRRLREGPRPSRGEGRSRPSCARRDRLHEAPQRGRRPRALALRRRSPHDGAPHARRTRRGRRRGLRALRQGRRLRLLRRSLRPARRPPPHGARRGSRAQRVPGARASDGSRSSATATTRI